MPDDLFTKKVLIIKCTLGKKIYFQSLLDTNTINIAFINEVMAHYVCKILNICFVELINQKLLKGFYGWSASLITYAIYLILIV